MSVAEGLLLTCGGFLLAVLWMDLIFDSQVRGSRDGQLPEQVLASIADYYRRATTTSRPMSRLIAAMMMILLGALVFQSVRGNDPVALIVVSFALAAAPILIAGARTVRNAVRLGGRQTTATNSHGSPGRSIGTTCCASRSYRRFSCSGSRLW